MLYLEYRRIPFERISLTKQLIEIFSGQRNHPWALNLSRESTVRLTDIDPVFPKCCCRDILILFRLRVALGEFVTLLRKSVNTIFGFQK